MTLALVHLMQGDVRGLIDDAISLGFLPEVRKGKCNIKKLTVLVDPPLPSPRMWTWIASTRT